jgi:hypothetical protein
MITRKPALKLYHDAASDLQFIEAWKEHEFLETGIIPLPPLQNSPLGEKVIFGCIYYGWKLKSKD